MKENRYTLNAAYQGEVVWTIIYLPIAYTFYAFSGTEKMFRVTFGPRYRGSCEEKIVRSSLEHDWI